jgi:hypothetical protein
MAAAPDFDASAFSGSANLESLIPAAVVAEVSEDGPAQFMVWTVDPMARNPRVLPFRVLVNAGSASNVVRGRPGRRRSLCAEVEGSEVAGTGSEVPI